ncbi:hypothetical protein LOCC1_G006444 [Lachnellula occidentalis]|uniref:BTB domain transcription factor n=1 Tax=Lachnellula occidentalis TaxID=215460 RepID=A0A8H8RSG9_9HELO|nr:hypothetical protein LOCC1_G006444 [Lachnellula occidentalis]
MAKTRSSQGSSPTKPIAAPKATKRAAAADGDAPKAKRGRPSKKAQKTIEETMNVDEDKDAEMSDGKGQETKDELMANVDTEGVEDDKAIAEEINGKSQESKGEDVKNGDAIEDDQAIEEQINGKAEDEKSGSQKTEDVTKEPEEKNAFDEVKGSPSEVKEAAHEEQEKKTKDIHQNNTSVVEDKARSSAIPSSILEKGIIYFFFRPRVNTTNPQGIEDVARSYIVLRPLPLGAKLGSGPLEDSGNARLLALPKKMLPKSKRDRFLVFVDKAGATVKELREVFQGNEYATKTVGTSTTEPVTPFAEGIYAITSTGRESHLAYHLTVPSPVGEIQKELGLHENGSFVVSAKNPETPSPGNAGLDNPAKYPEDLQKKFRGLRWMPLVPELLGYEGTQILLIGEAMGDMGKSVEEMSKDQRDGEKETPVEEMEKLEEEDHDRVENLKEDDPVFADLGLSSKEYPHLQTTW